MTNLIKDIEAINMGKSEMEIGKEVEKEHKGTIERLIDITLEKTGGMIDEETKADIVEEGITLIATDHIKEFSNYYTYLADMERRLNEDY
jgi:hypothetical protein